MKKTVLFSTLLLLVGCACPFGDCSKNDEVNIPLTKKTDTMVAENQQPATSVVVQEVCGVQTAAPNNCKSVEPVVLKPRVTETLSANKKRPCCDDNMWLEGENDVTYVPDAPEIYVISANRAINTMQKEAEPLFKQVGRMKVYVDKATEISDDLPGGIDKGTDIIKKRFKQMKNVKVVENKFVADYTVDSSADWYDTPTKTVPAIKYNIRLKDRGGNLIGEWSEIIHQAEGDRSWW